jgi:hypothetical protein
MDKQSKTRAKEAAAREGRFWGWAAVAACLYLAAMAALTLYGGQ